MAGGKANLARKKDLVGKEEREGIDYGVYSLERRRCITVLTVPSSRVARISFSFPPKRQSLKNGRKQTTLLV